MRTNIEYKFLILLILFSVNIVAKESITLATEAWPPYSFVDQKTKKVSGLSTEILNAVFKQMGVHIMQNDVLTWSRTQELGYQGKYDAVYTASINDERKKYMYFPDEPLVSTQWVLFHRKSDKEVIKLSRYDFLEGKTFCLVAGYNYPKFFKEYIMKHATIITVSHEDLNIAKLVYGRCDYMPAILETVLDVAKKDDYLRKINALEYLDYFKTSLLKSDFYIMFSKQNVSKAFVTKFSNYLKKYKQTKEYKLLLDKYKK